MLIRAIRHELGLTEEQQLMIKNVHLFFEREYPREKMRSAMSGDVDVCKEVRRRFAEYGLLSVLIYGYKGEQGLSALDAALLCEIAGMYLAPGELITSAILGALPVYIAGTDEQRGGLLNSVLEGEAAISPSLSPSLTLYIYDGKAPFTYRRDGSSYALSGSGAIALNCESSSHLEVLASNEWGEEPTLFLFRRGERGVRIERRECIDQSRGIYSVTLDEVEVDEGDMVGRRGEALGILRSIEPYILIAISAEMVGVAQHLLEITVSYLKERVAFGRPIGSFQELKHRAVDLLIMLENAHSLTMATARDLGGMKVDEARRLALAAKAYAGRVCIKMGVEAIHMHGGVGFSWDSDVHFYLRRGLMDEGLLVSSIKAEKDIALSLLEGVRPASSGV